jgi:hypothetical protein
LLCHLSALAIAATLCAAVALFVGAAATTAEFFKVNTTAGQLMLPYLAFVAYANALNYWFWQNNPDVSQCRDCMVVPLFILFDAYNTCEALAVASLAFAPCSEATAAEEPTWVGAVV